jgi:hypothetical protein
MMKRILPVFPILLIGVIGVMGVSCSKQKFEKFSQLGGPRILAIKADQPEIDGSGTGNVAVTLTPYISDIDGNGRVLSVRVVTCADLAIGQGNQPACSTPQVETYPSGNTFDTTSLMATNYTGAMTPITITIANPASLIAGYSDQAKFNGVPYSIFFSIQFGTTTITAVKQVDIGLRSSLNQNPQIQNITLDGTAITSSPSAGGTLSYSIASGHTPESFQVMDASGNLYGSQKETYLLTWFYYDAKIKPFRLLEAQNSQFVMTAGAGQATIVAVLRDQRGGTDVKIITP